MDNDVKRKLMTATVFLDGRELRRHKLSIADFMANSASNDPIDVGIELIKYLCCDDDRFNGFRDGLVASLNFLELVTEKNMKDPTFLKDLKSMLESGQLSSLRAYLDDYLKVN